MGKNWLCVLALASLSHASYHSIKEHSVHLDHMLEEMNNTMTGCVLACKNRASCMFAGFQRLQNDAHNVRCFLLNKSTPTSASSSLNLHVIEEVEVNPSQAAFLTNWPELKGSCNELYNSGERESGIYDLAIGKHYCQFITDGGGCGSGGWTLVLSIDGSKETFKFESALWENRNTWIGDASDLFVPLEKEGKYAEYSEMPVQMLCLATKANQFASYLNVSIVGGWMSKTLHNIISSGNYSESTNSAESWKNSFPGKANMHPYCNRRGLNSETIWYSQGRRSIRMGMMSNNQNDCLSTDTNVGVGFSSPSKISAGFSCTHSICGNVNLPVWVHVYIL